MKQRRKEVFLCSPHTYTASVEPQCTNAPGYILPGPHSSQRFHISSPIDLAIGFYHLRPINRFGMLFFCSHMHNAAGTGFGVEPRTAEKWTSGRSSNSFSKLHKRWNNLWSMKFNLPHHAMNCTLSKRMLTFAALVGRRTGSMGLRSANKKL